MCLNARCELSRSVEDGESRKVIVGLSKNKFLSINFLSRNALTWRIFTAYMTPSE